MAEITLKAATGRTQGSAASRRLRAEGKVPAVVYGAGVDPTAITVDWRELRLALTTDKGLNAVIELDVDGDSHPTIVKDMQRHPVRRDVVHVDFLVVERNKPVVAEVPIQLEGEPEKVLQQRGVVAQELHMLTVHAKPADIPGHLTLDITELEIGQTLTVAELTLPRGVTTDADPEQAVVSAQVTRAVEAETAEGAEGEAAEGEAGDGEGAEGDEAEGGGDGEGDAEGGPWRSSVAGVPPPSGAAPRPTSSWSAWPTRAATTPARATTWGPTRSGSWPSATARRSGSPGNGPTWPSCGWGRSGSCWPCPTPT
jgi:large subunit ribosomal protein L25